LTRLFRADAFLERTKMNLTELIDQVFQRTRQTVADIFHEYQEEEKRRLEALQREGDGLMKQISMPTLTK
jgi:hypothetical protein